MSRLETARGSASSSAIRTSRTHRLEGTPARRRAAGFVMAAILVLYLAASASMAQSPEGESGAAIRNLAAAGDRTISAPAANHIRDADAFIRSVFSDGDRTQFEAAAETYLRLLSMPARTEDDEAILQRHIQTALQVIPRGERPDNVGMRDAGEQIAIWWRRRDPFPATPRNERLEEHLSRWAFALEAFGSDDERGFDDRGDIYIRLGSPGKHLPIRLSDVVRAFDFPSSGMVPDIADSEMWVYRHVHDEAYYFFTRDSRRSGYRLARPSDAIPSRLQSGLDNRTDRGRQKSDVLLLVMEEMYAQLALAHPIFGSILDQIAGFRGRPRVSQTRPDLFARGTLSEASSLETESAGRRADVVPASFSDAIGLTEDLPLESRWARFLDPDGTTRTEIYWSIDAARLEPSRRLEKTLTNDGFTPTEDYVLAMSVARQDAGYHHRDIKTKHYLVKPASNEMHRIQANEVRGDTGVYNMAIQWTQHWTEQMSDGSLGEGALLKLATARLGTLQALDGSGERLEMSDLKAISPDEPDVPFPFSTMSREAPPDLYFELYNLNFGPDDQTRYTIEYEVMRPSDGRGGPDGAPTRARMTYSGSDRIAREHIGIDLSDWREGGAIQITVSATDEVRSEKIARSVLFVLDS